MMFIIIIVDDDVYYYYTVHAHLNPKILSIKYINV